MLFRSHAWLKLHALPQLKVEKEEFSKNVAYVAYIEFRQSFHLINLQDARKNAIV